MTHRENKKEAKRGSKKSKDNNVLKDSEMEKHSTKGVIKGNEES